jgi:hypothetical protein
MFHFYGFIDDRAGESSFSTKFYPSIEEVILSDNAYGEILEFSTIGLKPASGINPDMNEVPRLSAHYEMTTIEPYELSEYLDDRPEMSPANYIVFSRSDEKYDGMLTILEKI